MMIHRIFGLCLACILIAITDEPSQRTWKDRSGKFSVEATLVSADDESVVLKTSKGKEITIALERLSPADRAYVQQEMSSRSEPDSDETNTRDLGGEQTAAEPALTSSETSLELPKVKRETKGAVASDASELKELAQTFYADLRTKSRTEALSTLSDDARALVENNESALMYLPSPDASKNAIKVLKPKIAHDEAVVPVMVKLGGEPQKTALHLMRVDAKWRVFAISAKIGEFEKTINFEVALKKASQSRDPLLALVGQPIELQGLTLNGTPVSLANYKGKVVLIDFWATWCGPCREEIPNIAANYQKYHDMGFDVLAVSVDKDLAKLHEFVTAESPPWAVLADSHPQNPHSMAAQFGISGIPAFILVGADGKVIDVHCRGQRLGARLAEVFGK